MTEKLEQKSENGAWKVAISISAGLLFSLSIAMLGELDDRAYEFRECKNKAEMKGETFTREDFYKMIAPRYNVNKFSGVNLAYNRR